MGFIYGALTAIILIGVIAPLLIYIGLGVIVLKIAIVLIPIVLLIVFLSAIAAVIYVMCKYWRITLGVIVSLWLIGMLYSFALQYETKTVTPTVNYTYSNGLMKQ